jgi:hypothetical protein
MVVIAAVVVYRSHVYHKRKTEEDTAEDLSSFSDETIVDKSMDTILLTLGNVVNTYDIALEGLQKEDMKKLKKAKKTVRNMTVKTKYLKDHINVIVEKLQEDSISSGSYFVQVIDYLREMVHSVEYVVVPILNHVDNNHRPLKKEQIKELKEVYSKLERLIQLVARSIKSRDFSSQDEVLLMLEEYLKLQESIEFHAGFIDQFDRTGAPRRAPVNRPRRLFRKMHALFPPFEGMPSGIFNDKPERSRKDCIPDIGGSCHFWREKTVDPLWQTHFPQFNLPSQDSNPPPPDF